MPMQSARKMYHGRRSAILVTALIFVIMFSACRQLQNEQSDMALPRSTWWNYYERGLSSAVAGNWAAARQDFLRAIGSSADAGLASARDQRRVRTYGLRFRDDYFPNRELGVAYYYEGQVDTAIKYLNLSLATEPSARARDYLLQIRRQQLRDSERQGRLQHQPVQFDLQLDVEPEQLVNRAQLQLRGVIASEFGVEQVWINGRRTFVDQAPLQHQIDATLQLSCGEQLVTVEAQDLLGQRYRWNQLVTVDVQAPLLAVHPQISGSTTALDRSAELVITDDHGLHSVSIDGEALEIAAGVRQVRVKVGTAAPVRVLARDHAGNVLDSEIAAAQLQMAAVALAHADRQLVDLAPPGPRRQSPVPAAPPAPPLLTLLPEPEVPTVVTTSFYILDVLVQAPAGVERIEVQRAQDKQLLRLAHDAAAVLLRSSCRIDLYPGANDLTIIVRDRNGQETRRQLTLIRQLDNRWREDLRMSAHLIAPQQQWPQVHAIDFSGLLLESFLEQPRRLKLVQHDQQVLEQILLEKALAASDVVALQQAVQSGRLAAAEWLLVSRLARWPGQDNWDVYLRVVDVETGQHIVAADMHFRGYEQAAIALALQGLAGKLKQQLPTLTAPLLLHTGGAIKVAVGSQANIRPGYRFLFLPGDAADLLHAPPRQQQNQWLEGIVVQTTAEHSIVELIDKQALTLLQAHDMAVVR